MAAEWIFLGSCGYLTRLNGFGWLLMDFGKIINTQDEHAYCVGIRFKGSGIDYLDKLNYF